MICACIIAAGLALAQSPPAVQADPPHAKVETATGQPGPQIAEGIVPAGVAEVWRIFSTPEGFKSLGVAKCDMDFRVGGLIRTHYSPQGVLGDEGTIQNEILSFEPERMLSIRIHTPPKGFPFSRETYQKTWTVITLTDLGDRRTHVRIAGMGYPATDDGDRMREFFRQGNDWTIKKLASAYNPGAAPRTPAHTGTPLSPIELEQLVDLPRDEAWALLATSDGWKRSFGVASKIELRPGGAFEIYFSMEAPEGQRGSEGCSVLSLVPGRMLSYTWSAPPRFSHARALRTWVVAEFDEVSASRTRIRLTHLGFDAMAEANPDHKAEWEQTRAYFASAWPKVLGAIAAQGAR